jgi:hypothetical protein
VGNGTTINGKVAPYAIRLVEANVTADVVSVTVSGDYGRLHTANGAEYDGADLHSAEFCVSNCQQSDCTAALKRISPGPIWLAVTGDAAGSTYSIAGKQTSCECLVGTWTVTNEVVAAAHLSGGAGITWTIGPDGTLTISYAGSAPIVGVGISVQYSGTESAQVTFTSDPTAASGTWTIRFDAGSLVATTDVAGYKTTRSVPSVPGASGTWTCQGNMMTTTYGNGVGQMISAHRP